MLMKKLTIILVLKNEVKNIFRRWDAEAGRTSLSWLIDAKTYGRISRASLTLVFVCSLASLFSHRYQEIFIFWHRGFCAFAFPSSQSNAWKRLIFTDSRCHGARIFRATHIWTWTHGTHSRTFMPRMEDKKMQRNVFNRKAMHAITKQWLAEALSVFCKARTVASGRPVHQGMSSPSWSTSVTPVRLGVCWLWAMAKLLRTKGAL